MNQPYIIVTPAYNEQNYIDKLVESVVSQTVLPRLWVIVDDGSTDKTGDIVRRYASKYDWIRYVYHPKTIDQSYYGSNVCAILEGLRYVKDEKYEYLAILDADISLPRDYYEQIFARFERDEKLGVASGVYQDLVNGKLRKVLNDRRSTPKAIQVFRRECYEKIGGYLPMKYGGEDTVACVMARMNGWKSWSFPELCVIHNKPAGTGHAGNILTIRFRQGLNEYGIGGHPLFVLLKFIRRCVKERPYILGGFARIAGFLYGCCLQEKHQISDDVIRFIRAEQVERIFRFNKIPERCQNSRIKKQ
jgi:glycosyltransferase involved in cell wall biosynthesis